MVTFVQRLGHEIVALGIRVRFSYDTPIYKLMPSEVCGPPVKEDVPAWSWTKA